MSVFLKDEELEAIKNRARGSALDDLYWLYVNKAKERQAQPGLFNHSSSQEWWHLCFEYVSESCLAYRLKPNETLGSWIGNTVLAIVRRPREDWVGPWFRNHTSEPPVGHLETAHLSWTVAVAYDLCRDIFTEPELRELEDALEEKAMTLCEVFVSTVPRGINNWFCILLAGLIVPAAVLGRRDLLKDNLPRVQHCLDLFQEDGSYGESPQYANYALQGLYLVVESYHRAAPDLFDLNLAARYAGAAELWSYNFLHKKYLSSWGVVPRSFNFGDSAAIFGPSGDILLHMAATLKKAAPQSARLARWLFDRIYLPVEQCHDDDRKSFGFVPGMGFLTPVLLSGAVEAAGPEELNLARAKTFDNGYTYLRDNWGGDTALAVAGANKPLNVVSHLHGDINSLILTHRGERLLVDAGHSCYRGLIHQQEIMTSHHNTCTFILPERNGVLLQQTGHRGNSRRLEVSGLNQPATRGRKIGTLCDGPLAITAHDGAELYGETIKTFARYTILCGREALFIIDSIEGEEPVIPVWNWVLNNRDGRLEMNLPGPSVWTPPRDNPGTRKEVKPSDRFVARSGQAGMKMFHGGGGVLSGPVYAYMNDAYHPLPGQKGEGRQGSAHIYRWTGKKAGRNHTVLHALALGSYGSVANWHYHKDGQRYELEIPGESWAVTLEEGGFILNGRVDDSHYERRMSFGEEF